MSEIKVSIVIPIYNSYEYIDRCLESLLNQTLKEIEIICINDGSTDNSLNKLEEYSRKYDNIVVYSKENGGCGSARNMGIEKAKGEYIEFIDSDDLIEPYTVEYLYNSAIKHNSDLVVCGMHRIDDVTGKLITTDMTNVKKEFIDINDATINELLFINPGPCNKLHKKSIFEFARFPKIPVVDDLMLTLQYMPFIKRISFVTEPLYKYKVRKESGVNTVAYSTYEKMKDMFVKIKEDYKLRNVEDRYFEYISKMAFIHVGISMLYRMAYIKDINMKKEVKKTLNFLDLEFSEWNKISKIKNVKLVSFKKVLSVKLVYYMYKMNMANLFISMYIFLICKLNIDIKW